MELTRREFLKLASAAAATLALGGCGLPVQQALVSQLDMPEHRLPGESRWFATTCGECGGGCGVSVRVADGRAKKIEGIATHPVSHGKVCARGQSALQALYNPDRLTGVMRRQGSELVPVEKWDDALKALAGQLDAGAGKPGSALWVTGPLRGSRGALVALLARRVGARIWVLDFPGTIPERAAMKGLTGHARLPHLPIETADYVVNFGGDFLATGPSVVRDSWAYGEFRRGGSRKRGTLVSFTSRLNMTAANSDRWVPVRPGYEGWVALGVGNLLAEGSKRPWPDWARAIRPEAAAREAGVPVELVERLARKLSEAKSPLAIGGFQNGSCTNGLASLWIIQALNRLLTGAVPARETDLLVPIPGEGKEPELLYLSTRDALRSLQSGAVQTIWFLDANPAFLLPKKLEFEKLLAKVPAKVAFTPYLHETAKLSDWVLPTRSWLEAWGDQRLEGAGMKGVYALRQPVVEPRAASMELADILLAAVGQSGEALKKGISIKSMQDLLQSRFNREEWETGLARAGLWDEHPLDWEPYGGRAPMGPPPPVKGRGKMPAGRSSWDHLPASKVSGLGEPKTAGDGLVLIPFPSPVLHDGSVANRPWLLELPDPLSALVWGEWVEIHPTVAEKGGIERGDLVRVSSSAGSIEAPAYPTHGIHPEAVAMPVGMGHASYGRYANGGANPLSILEAVWQEATGEPAWIATKVRLEKTGRKGRLLALDQRVGGLHREVFPR